MLSGLLDSDFFEGLLIALGILALAGIVTAAAVSFDPKIDG